MAKRTGVPSLLQVAIRMCDLLNKFSPIITVLYPTNVALLAALAAAEAACHALRDELAAVRETGD